MYDREDLCAIEAGIEESIRSIRNAEDELTVINFPCKETILDEITDVVNDLIDELTSIREKIRTYNEADALEELRDYNRSIV